MFQDFTRDSRRLLLSDGVSTKMTRRALCLLLACVPRALSATRAASAEDAVARMYSFWCTESHQAQAVCRRRALIYQYNAATSAKERKPILVSLHAISKSEASKTYTAMKKQFCSTADAKALPICTDHGGMWVDDAVFEWLCVKPDLSTDQRRMCDRQDVARKLRGLTNTTARKELLKWPAPALDSDATLTLSHPCVARPSQADTPHPVQHRGAPGRLRRVLLARSQHGDAHLRDDPARPRAGRAAPSLLRWQPDYRI